MARGRPKADDAAKMEQINKQPELLKRYNAFMSNIEHYLGQKERASDAMKDVTNEASKALGLSIGFLGRTAKANIKGNAEELLNEAEAVVRGVELRSASGDSEEAVSDESF